VVYTNGKPAKFIGGLNVERPFLLLRRLNATWPLATLVVAGDGIDLAGVGPLRRLAEVRAAREDVVAVFRVRPFFPTTGVGFELAGGEVAYFWTFRRGLVLDVLARRGYPVTEPRWMPWRHVIGR
jgi:hypothetical protein